MAAGPVYGPAATRASGGIDHLDVQRLGATPLRNAGSEGPGKSVLRTPGVSCKGCNHGGAPRGGAEGAAATFVGVEASGANAGKYGGAHAVRAKSSKPMG